MRNVSEDIDKLRFNRCVAHIYEFANALGDAIGGIETAPAPDLAWALREAGDILVRLFHPMMPHLAEECWAALGHKTLVATEAWPQVEPDLLVENTHHPAGPDQRQKARRCDRRPRCRKMPRLRLPFWRSMR